MTDLIHPPRMDEEKLTSMLRDLVRAAVRRLPDPIAELARKLRRADSSEEFNSMKDDLASLGIDWSRVGPTTTQWNAQYCQCVFCDASVANKDGIIKHVTYYDCPVFGAIVTLARADFCDTSEWQVEQARHNAEQAERARNLCVVDLGQGQEVMQSGHRQRNDLEAIEPRVAELGFAKVVRKLSGGQTETRWEMTTDDAYVLADPRNEGRIYIRAWPLDGKGKPIQKKSRRWHAPEHILDGWRKDLPKKVATRVAKQLAARQ